MQVVLRELVHRNLADFGDDMVVDSVLVALLRCLSDLGLGEVLIPEVQPIAEGHFREDLFHRLNVIPIHVPSLDDRKEDIPLLVNHFAELICKEQGWRVKDFDSSAVVALQEKTWPGNIRELRNVVERLIILGGEVITAEDVANFA